MANNPKLILTTLALIVTGVIFYQTALSRRQLEHIATLKLDREADRAKLREQTAALTRVQNELALLKSRPASSDGAVPSVSFSTPTATSRPNVLPANSAASTSHAESVERIQLHQRYDPFLVRLGLTPEQRDRFVQLRLAINQARADLQAAVEQNGMQGHSETVEAQRTKLTKAMWDEIRQLLGPDGYKAYGDYEMTSAYRPVVEALFNSAGVAISGEQAEQITRLMNKNKKTFQAKPTDIGSQVQFDWNAAARDAETLLTPAQLAVLHAKAAQSPLRE